MRAQIYHVLSRFIVEHASGVNVIDLYETILESHCECAEIWRKLHCLYLGSFLEMAQIVIHPTLISSFRGLFQRI